MGQYPVLLRWTQCHHKGPESGGEAQKRWRNEAKEGQRDAMLLPLKLEERGHEPRNMGGLWRLEKVRKQIRPGAYRKECSHADALISAP